MYFNDLCKAEGVADAGLIDKIRHLWVETFYQVGGLTELTDHDLKKLQNVLSGGHRLSDQKITEIRKWISLQKDIVNQNQ